MTKKSKHSNIWRASVCVAIISTAAIALSGCSGNSPKSVASVANATHVSGKISLWHFFTDVQAKEFQGIVAGFEKKYPDVKVDIHPAQTDEQLTKVIASTPGSIDVAMSPSSDNTGLYCSSGEFEDLSGLIKQSKIDMTQFPKITRAYTSFDGKQCALPLLMDTYGLYYNTTMLKSAGITAPPKTLSQLETDALKMTTYNSDGSIKTLGFNPLMGFYQNTPARWAPVVGATWLDGSGKSDLNTPAWQELMKWQKAFVDKIGYKKLQAFSAGVGNLGSTNNAFETSQLAMMLDGEYRINHLIIDKSKVKFETAPFPVADDHADLYGGGYGTGTIISIAKGSKNQAAAWALVKYLTTDTASLVDFTNVMKNVPTTTASLTSSGLKLPSQFKTFLDIAQSPHLATTTPTPIGVTNQNMFATYWDKWQSGNGGDLNAGLTKLDKDINSAISLSAG